MKRMSGRSHASQPLFFICIAILFISCGPDAEERRMPDDPEKAYLDDYEGPDRKWGFMDKSGEIIIPAKYDLVSGFTEGLAAVNYRGRWGYIDQAGGVVIPYEFLAAWPFYCGVARVTAFDGSVGLIDRQGTRLELPENIDRIYDCKNGRLRFEAYDKTGYLYPDGSVAIPPEYDAGQDFENGYARVTRSEKEGLIDTTGKLIVPFEYDRIYIPDGGRILVRSGETYQYLDGDGAPLASTYERAGAYVNNYAPVKDAVGWYLINFAGEEQFPERYRQLRHAGKNIWIARTENGALAITTDGKRLTTRHYDQINNFSEGVAAYMRDGLCGFIDTSGNEVLSPQYGLAWDFQEGLARAAFRDGIAFINKSGRIPFIPRVSEIRDFSGGLAPFQE